MRNNKGVETSNCKNNGTKPSLFLLPCPWITVYKFLLYWCKNFRSKKTSLFFFSSIWQTRDDFLGQVDVPLSHLPVSSAFVSVCSLCHHQICELEFVFICIVEWVNTGMLEVIEKHLHQIKVSWALSTHGAWALLFLPEFDPLLLMDVITWGKWLCSDFHNDAYLDMSVMVDLES